MRQRVLRRVVGQFMRPHGAAGHLAGWVMAHRSSNVRRNHWVVSLLEVQPEDRVLEIGFGPGLAIEEISRLASRGSVFGVDHSEVMVRDAGRRNAAAVRTGRVELRLCAVDALPDFGDPLDKVLAVNSLGFWPDPLARLTELRTRLRPGGTIALASQPRCPGETSARAATQMEGLLRSAGFTGVRTEVLALDPPVACVLAHTGRPSAEFRDED